MTADDGPGLERQMGCMAGIFHHLFDRSSYIPSSRRFVSPKSLLLPASDDAESVSPSEKSDASCVILAEQSANANVSSAVKGAPWKNLEVSRLSLDSRAVTDAKGKLHRRSPGAVARLMGLEALPDQDVNSKPAHVLRRSSSDSRARNDPSFYQFVDATAFQKAPLKENATKQRSNHNSFIQRKSFELFPSEQPRRVAGAVQPVPVSLYCEIERRLRVRGIEEPAKDLKTLKQVLDAVQLRGLLHSKPSDGYKEFLDGYHRSPGSPVVLMKPGSKPSRSPWSDPGSDMLQPQARRCTDRSRRVAKSEVRRGMSDRKLSPIGSPVGSPRRVVPGPGTVRSGVNNNNRRRDGNVVHRGISTGTGTGYNKLVKSPSVQYHWEEERTGRNILERCDELLYSIAAITPTDQNSREDPQPSPVSVLDSLFHADECYPPSPKTKRSLRFQDQLFDWAHEQSNDEMSTVRSDCSDPDYMFVAEVMRYSDRCRDSSKLFASLDQKHPRFGATDHASLHHRRLLYDLVCEMLNRRHHMSLWEAFECTRSVSSARLVQIQMPDTGDVWQQIQRMKEPIIIANEVVTDVTSVAISKDMAADHTWSRQSVELSDAVLQIERMIFKDLVADSIKVLTDVASASYHHHPRRKLIF